MNDRVASEMILGNMWRGTIGFQKLNFTRRQAWDNTIRMSQADNAVKFNFRKTISRKVLRGKVGRDAPGVFDLRLE